MNFHEEITSRLETPAHCENCNNALRACFAESLSQHTSIDPFVWTRGELKSKSHQGCRFCLFLLRILETDPRLHCQNAQASDELCMAPQYVGSVHFVAPNGAHEYSRCYRPKLYLYVAGTDPDDGFGFVPKGNALILLPSLPSEDEMRYLPEPAVFSGRHIDSVANFPLIRAWMNLCEKHSVADNECNARNWDLLPKESFRMIDVDQSCVIEQPVSLPFVALSYVWGASKRLLLTEGTRQRLHTPGGLSSHHKDIPRAFIDSMQVCRLLGARYLWIDALCIQQDNEKDVKTHMSAMGHVYEAATMTIASNAPSADHGLPGVSLERDIHRALYDLGPFTIVTAQPSYGLALENGPWDSRGWTLQEKLFASRLLIFTFSGVFFRCQRATWSEDLVMEPDIGPFADLKIQLAEERSRASKMTLESAGGSHTYEVRRDWTYRGLKGILNAYIKRQLSFEGDMVNALSGVLSSYDAALVGGYPLKYFHRLIPWYTTGPKSTRRRQGFPSWSWAGWVHELRTNMKFLETPGGDECDLDVKFNALSSNDDVTGSSEPDRWVPVPYVSTSERSWGHAEDYGLPDHIGGRFFYQRPFKPLPAAVGSVVPGSHVLRFRTSSALLYIARDGEEATHTDGEEGDPSVISVGVYNPTSRELVGRMKLDREWRDTYWGLAEFIVICRAQFDLMNSGVSRRGFALMLIKEEHGLSFRVDLFPEVVTLETWRAAKPSWKAFNLA